MVVGSAWLDMFVGSAWLDMFVGGMIGHACWRHGWTWLLAAWNMVYGMDMEWICFGVMDTGIVILLNMFNLFLLMLVMKMHFIFLALCFSYVFMLIYFIPNLLIVSYFTFSFYWFIQWILIEFVLSYIYTRNRIKVAYNIMGKFWVDYDIFS